MASQASVVTPTRLTGIVLAFVPPALFTAIGVAAWGEELGLLFGMFAYVLHRLVLVRRVVCRDHRRGVVLMKQGKFEESVAAFRQSEAFWAKHPTLDRLRAPLLGSPTSHGFQVFAVYNQAYGLARLGRGSEALALVERVLAEHPDMLPARELRDVLAAGRSVPT